jgi:hypothetical protein
VDSHRQLEKLVESLVYAQVAKTQWGPAYPLEASPVDTKERYRYIDLFAIDGMTLQGINFPAGRQQSLDKTDTNFVVLTDTEHPSIRSVLPQGAIR